MIVRLDLYSFEGDRRSVFVQRRANWLPPRNYRETLSNNDWLLAWRDYRLDRRASESGVLVYRQTDPKGPETVPHGA